MKKILWRLLSTAQRLWRDSEQRDPVSQLAELDPRQLRVVVGLGNPGLRFQGTRHNIGFECVNRLATEHSVQWHTAPFLFYSAAVAAGAHKTLVLAKPTTYMNESGSAVKDLLERLRVTSEQILVVYDDMDLPLGRVRLRARGSPGTHNGMRSVLAALGAEDLPRLRIGIGQKNADAIDHVLGEFRDAERPAVDEALDRAVRAIQCWADQGVDAAMNRCNG